MSITEDRPNCIISGKLPALDRDAFEFLGAITAILVPEDIFLTNILGAGRVGSEKLGWKIALAAIFPDNGEFCADQLYVLRLHPL